jgi:hypothetical protein
MNKLADGIYVSYPLIKEGVRGRLSSINPHLTSPFVQTGDIANRCTET